MGFHGLFPQQRSMFLPMLILILVTASTTLLSGQQDANSTRKIRIKPGPISSRIGTAVNWVDRFDRAKQLSEQTGKPIFWYVPTLNGSFMDRKDSIHRYMMAGPFSWEATRKYLNRNFICLKAAADGVLQKKYQLLPYKFVEPGFLIIDQNGNVTRRVDKITTLHPGWFLHLLGGESIELGDSRAWKEFRNGNYMVQPANFDDADSSTEAIRERLLSGMLAFRRGDHAQAKKIWQKLASDHSTHPLGWKAAAEAEGFGPFVRGFEIHRTIPDAALKSGLESAGSAAPPATFSERQLVQRGVNFLLGMQRDDGGWVDCDYDFGGTDSLPNVHVAVTALAGMALLSAQCDVSQREFDEREVVIRCPIPARFLGQLEARDDVKVKRLG